MITASPKAIELIKRHEGLRLKAYRCSAGKATIGYGHTAGVKIGDKITAEQALKYLEDDVNAVVADLNILIKTDLTQNQQDAIVSFVYNIGVGAFGASTMLKKINKGLISEVPAQFLRWVYAGGKISNGLIRRRKDEAALFIS